MEMGKFMIDQHLEDFRYFSNDDIQKVQTHGILRQYKKGQVLFDSGDERTKIYFLKTGVIKIEKTDTTGTFFYMHFLQSGGLFPRIGLFADSKYTYSAVAYTDIEVFSIPITVFEELMMNNTHQLTVWIKSQSAILKSQMTKIQKGTMYSTNHRVVTTLAIIYKDLGEVDDDGFMGLSFPITISDIARASGTTRETTSTIMKSLTSMNKIKYVQKKLTFLDMAYFSDFLKD
ncbi:MAG: Crp/Fnr family transcriptional regulator [Vagococcus sp.]